MTHTEITTPKHIEDALEILPDENVAEVLRRTRISQYEADQFCQQRYGKTFAEKRQELQQADAYTRRRQKFYCPDALQAGRRTHAPHNPSSVNFGRGL